MKKDNNEYADLSIALSKISEGEQDILNNEILMESLRKLADE